MHETYPKHITKAMKARIRDRLLPTSQGANMVEHTSDRYT